jgi:putative hydrolase of the HAD superfamily
MGTAIKAVVFDYGGVISLSPTEAEREAVAAKAGVPLKTLDELERQYRGEYDRGTVNGRDYFKGLLSRSGVFQDDESLDKIALADSLCWRHINTGTEKLIEDIQKHGIKAGILSNMPSEFLDWARINLPVFSKVDFGIFSCELKLIKPEPPIYEALVAKIGCTGKDIVFFDDLKHNVKGAKALGIRAFVWKDPETARKKLRKIDKDLAEL